MGSGLRASKPSRRAAGIHVLARQRMREPPVGPRLASEQLEDRKQAAIEGMRGAGEIDAPHAILLFTCFVPRSLRVCLEALDPVPERSRVVLAQGLGVDQLEPFGGESLDHP